METAGGSSLPEDCEKFRAAAADVGFSCKFPDTEKAASKFGSAVALQLWGLYMQATQGQWNPQKSSPYCVHRSWRSLGDMAMEEAMRKFLEVYEKEDRALNPMVPEYGVQPAANTQMNESQVYGSVLGLKLNITDELLDQLANFQTVEVTPSEAERSSNSQRVSQNDDIYLCDEGPNDQEQTANQTQDVHLAASTSQFDPSFPSRDSQAASATSRWQPGETLRQTGQMASIPFANQIQDLPFAPSTSQYSPSFATIKHDTDTEIPAESNRIQSVSITPAAESNSGVEKMDEDEGVEFD